MPFQSGAGFETNEPKHNTLQSQHTPFISLPFSLSLSLSLSLFRTLRLAPVQSVFWVPSRALGEDEAAIVDLTLVHLTGYEES